MVASPVLARYDWTAGTDMTRVASLTSVVETRLATGRLASTATSIGLLSFWLTFCASGLDVSAATDAGFVGLAGAVVLA